MLNLIGGVCMKSDFVDLLADFVRQAEPDLNFRLETQSEELEKLPCIEPTIGKWVDAHDVDYMLAAFALDDEDFAADFPGLAHISQHDRARIIEAFQIHFERCLHCSRKRSYDSEFNSRVDHVLQKKRMELLHFLDQAMAGESDGDEDHFLSVEIAANK